MIKSTRRSLAKFLRARFSPAAVVLTAASLFIAAGVVARFAGEETVDARLTLEGRARRVDARRARSEARAVEFIENDLHARYADRLRDASGLTVGLGVYAMHERTVKGRVVPDVNALLEGVRQSSLLPPKMSVANASGVVRAAAGLYYVRYRPAPFGVEVLSVGAQGLRSGDVFIVRIPETSPVPTDGLPQSKSAGSYATIFTAPDRDTVVPKPFAPAAAFAGAGWTQQPLRAAPFSAQQVAELNAWVARRAGK